MLCPGTRPTATRDRDLGDGSGANYKGTRVAAHRGPAIFLRETFYSPHTRPSRSQPQLPCLIVVLLALATPPASASLVVVAPPLILLDAALASARLLPKALRRMSPLWA